jgi:hypothetical protein
MSDNLEEMERHVPKTHRLNDFEQRCLHAIQKLLRSQRIIIVYDERSRAHHILNVPVK